MNFVVMGVAGCGKSTIAMALADKLSATFLEGDDFHSEENVLLMSQGYALTDNDRQPWLQAINAQLQRDAKTGSIVLSCSALKQSYRSLLSVNVSPLVFVYLKGTKALIEQRMMQRQNHFMPLELISSQFEALEEPDKSENFISVDIQESVHSIVEKVIASVKSEI